MFIGYFVDILVTSFIKILHCGGISISSSTWSSFISIFLIFSVIFSSSLSSTRIGSNRPSSVSLLPTGMFSDFVSLAVAVSFRFCTVTGSGVEAFVCLDAPLTPSFGLVGPFLLRRRCFFCVLSFGSLRRLSSC